MGKLLHEEIYNDILKKIKSHEYEEGELLPAEMKLCEVYNASRTPVRQALQKLYDEGFIVRQAGYGTFVAGRQFWPDMEMGGCQEELVAKGPYLRCRTLNVQNGTVDEKMAEVLHVPVNTPVVAAERVRYYQNEPIHYLRHYTFKADVETLKRHGNFSSMLAIYEELGLKINATEEVLEAVAAKPEIAKVLELPLSYPLLLVNRYTFDEKGNLIEFVYFYIKSDNWKYRTHYKK